MALTAEFAQRLIRRWWHGLNRPPTRASRHLAPQLHPLEDRVVLSRFGGFEPGGFSSLRFGGSRPFSGGNSVNANGSTSSAGTDTGSTTLAASLRRGRGGRNVIQDADLTAHLEQLRNDQLAVLSGSSVTDAQRLALRTDLRDLGEAGVCLDPATLAPVIDSLLTTLADGTYDSDATVARANQDAFNALFADTGVDQTLIDKTYTDIVAIARNLNLSTDGLTQLAADREAIDADLERLGFTSTRGFSQSNLDLILSPGLSFRGPRRARF